MPGRNPNEAVAAFLAPFEEATKVLHGFCRCSILGKRDYRIGTQHTLVVNPDKEKNLPRLGSFSAELRFELIEADPKKYGGTVRCTTRGYRYRLADLSGHELWLLHWHPSGTAGTRIRICTYPLAPNYIFLPDESPSKKSLPGVSSTARN